MTIYRTLLSKGYLPKELPPHFTSQSFAKYATSQGGRTALKLASLPSNSADCATFTLALPGLENRLLAIPHPKTYVDLAFEVSKSFKRLLAKANASSFCQSRPVYTTHDHRAVRTRIDPANLARERATARAYGSFLLKADISQFYPSLYTHAVGWAIDPKTRLRANWKPAKKHKLLGGRIDQLLMNLQGKVSQGIPVGNDISFLLAEIVLGQVDRELREYAERSFRWFDDYEITCDSRADAEKALAKLRAALRKFNLRINSKKTGIFELPISSADDWQHVVMDASRDVHIAARNIPRFFDTVFQVRAAHPTSPVLLYAIGLLFKIARPPEAALRVAVSCISQAVLCEPGCAQKAFALLTYWSLNGASLNSKTIVMMIERIIERHSSVGATSDVSWALSFSISQGLELTKRTGRFLEDVEEDCVVIQALHAHKLGLVPQGFNPKSMIDWLGKAATDGPHWLALYEAVRQAFAPSLQPQLTADPLFRNMLESEVAFYRQRLPPYAAVVHQGGAPQWVLRAWLTEAAQGSDSVTPQVPTPQSAVADMVKADAQRLAEGAPYSEVIARLLASKQRSADDDDNDDDVDLYA